MTEARRNELVPRSWNCIVQRHFWGAAEHPVAQDLKALQHAEAS